MLTMYPAMRYSRDGRQCLVRSEEESAALGPDWSNTPATWDTTLHPPAPPPATAVSPAGPKKRGRPRKVKADGGTYSY